MVLLKWETLRCLGGLVSCSTSSGPLNFLSIYAPTLRTPRMASTRHLSPKQRDPVHRLRLAWFQCPSGCWWSSLLPTLCYLQLSQDRLRHYPLSTWPQPRRTWCLHTATTRTSTAEVLLWSQWRSPQGLSHNPRDCNEKSNTLLEIKHKYGCYFTDKHIFRFLRLTCQNKIENRMLLNLCFHLSGCTISIFTSWLKYFYQTTCWSLLETIITNEELRKWHLKDI